jgi:photosystem II stability/assembly factor-like uncharacterized protein
MRISFVIAGLFSIASIAQVACSSSSSPPPPPTDGGGTSAWHAAVGAGGVLTQTFDDATWSSRVVAPGALRAVACVGNLHGWAAGDAGFVARTDDGGSHWSVEDAHTTVALRAIRFATTSLGVVAGDAGVLAYTRDGGSTWNTVAPLTASALRGAAAGTGLLLVVGDGGVVLRSIDDGATWSASTIANGVDLRGAAADPGAHVVYAVDARGGIWSSADRGATFAREAAASAGLEAISVSDDGARAIAAGLGGVAMVKLGGAWSTVSVGTSVDLHAALASDLGLYVAGEQGTLLGSHDGRAFTARAIGTSAALYGLDDL